MRDPHILDRTRAHGLAAGGARARGWPGGPGPGRWEDAMSAPRVAAKILSDDVADLGDELAGALPPGADWLHVDVMDPHDVPNLTVGPLVCAALRSLTSATLDVHLMMKPVDVLVPAFANAGADLVTFHPEASYHLQRTVTLVKEHGCGVGLALNPATPLGVLEHVLEDLDAVVLMFADPDPEFGGQRFMRAALAKIRAVRERIAATGRAITLEVDGGVKPEDAAEVFCAGADVFVAGSAPCGSGDYATAVAALEECAARHRRALVM